MRNTILIVDDVEMNRDILSGILGCDYKILEAGDGEEALAVIEGHKDELIMVLLDLMMPVLSGYDVLKELNRTGIITTVPVLVISTENSVYSERECFSLGVSDFIRKPFDTDIVRRRVSNVTSLYLYKQHLEEKVEEQTRIIRRWNNNIIELLGNTVESRNLESGEHVQRVKGYTEIMANEVMKQWPEYGLTPAKVKVITNASALHDVGKISIPDAILLKPGKLTDEEFEKMKEHTTIGGEFIAGVNDLWDEEYGKVSYEIARHHHEKFDGRGYPDHLVGDDIPIAAQIVSVADVYDALVSKRCYKDAYGKDTAYQMILNGECGRFNPKLMSCLEAVKDKFEQLASQ